MIMSTLQTFEITFINLNVDSNNTIELYFVGSRKIAFSQTSNEERESIREGYNHKHKGVKLG